MQTGHAHPAEERGALSTSPLCRTDTQRSPEAFQLLRTRLGYTPDIAGQVLGWWYGLDDAPPAMPPPWRPTGSLLPAGGDDLRHGGQCLVLIEVDDCWDVLSERALLTYAFGSRLAEAEP